MIEKATSSSWKTEPFGSLIAIPFARVFSDVEFQKLIFGLIPKAMEDKWFIYYEDRNLKFYRSWTGFGVFKVQMYKKEDNWKVESAFVSSQIIKSWGTEYSIEILDSLIGVLLLDENKPFPLRSDVKEETPKILQHGIAGNDYSEVGFKIKSPWWKFWDR